VYDKWNVIPQSSICGYVSKYLGCIILTHYNTKAVPEHHFFYIITGLPVAAYTNSSAGNTTKFKKKKSL
jgi:hypothetical protein